MKLKNKFLGLLSLLRIRDSATVKAVTDGDQSFSGMGIKTLTDMASSPNSGDYLEAMPATEVLTHKVMRNYLDGIVKPQNRGVIMKSPENDGDTSLGFSYVFDYVVPGEYVISKHFLGKRDGKFIVTVPENAVMPKYVYHNHRAWPSGTTVKYCDDFREVEAKQNELNQIWFVRGLSFYSSNIESGVLIWYTPAAYGEIETEVKFYFSSAPLPLYNITYEMF